MGLRARVAAWEREPLRAVVLRARLQRPLRRHQFASFGDHSILHKPAWLYGAHKMSIGANCLLLRGCWLSVERPGWDRPGAVLEIGDHVAARMNCTLSAAERITIEDHVVFGSAVTVIDNDHTWDAGHPSVLQNPLKTSPVRVGEGTWVGDRATILSGSDIGRQCIIGTNSVVKGEIPDFSIAVGAPARVVGSTR